jgi:cytochrome P450
MSYLNAAIKETLRMYPPAPLGGVRATSKPTKVNRFNQPSHSPAV